MKAFFTILTILLCLEISHGNNDRVNEGASTSTQGDEDPLDKCTRCEVQIIAYKLVFLMLAEDHSHHDLIHLMNNQFHELEAFHETVTQIILEAAGPLDLPLEERNHRIRYFYSMIERFVMETLEKACTQHYKHRFYYEYDSEERTVTILEKTDLLTGNCLCVVSHNEREVLSITHKLPRPKKPEITSMPIQKLGGVMLEEVTVYYIIPIQLISRFFNVWLMEENVNRVIANFFNRCTATLFGRLRRSMQKLLLYGLKESGVYASSGEGSLNSDDISFSNEPLLIRNLMRSQTWMSGNMFIGPVERGPTDPAFGRAYDELLEAFDSYIEPIIGTYRYDLLFNLNKRLQAYIRHAPRMSLVGRLNIGFVLFSSMIYVFHQYPITSFNVDQWQELESFDGSENYWIIRPRRNPRSNNYYEYETLPENSASSLGKIKNRWRKFVDHVMSISIEAQSRNESLPWSCDWTCLYSEYLNQTSSASKPNDKCQECTSFDEFLYQKASNKSKWDVCNIKAESALHTSRWCAAWRRIMDDINDIEHKKFLGASRWESLSQTDIETIISWLISKKKDSDYLQIFKKDPLEYKKSVSSLDVGLCLLTTLIPNILRFKWSNCRQELG